MAKRKKKGWLADDQILPNSQAQAMKGPYGSIDRRCEFRDCAERRKGDRKLAMRKQSTGLILSNPKG
jgi:hypothetical protein